MINSCTSQRYCTQEKVNIRASIGRFFLRYNAQIIVATQVFNLLSGLSLITVGLKEIFLDSQPQWFNFEVKEEYPWLVQKIIKTTNRIFIVVRNQTDSLVDRIRYGLHGISMMASGVTGMIAAAHRLGWLNLGSTLRFFDLATGGFFIFGNLIYLEFNLEKFVLTVKDLVTGCPDKRIAFTKLIAVCFGLLSNLIYIIASIATLALTPPLIPIVLGVIALSAGGLRILLESGLAIYEHQKEKANIVV